MISPRKAILCFLTFGMSAFASDFNPNEVLVKYKDHASRSRIKMNQLYSSVGVEDVQHYSDSMSKFELLKLKENVRVNDAIMELEKSDSVEYAQPNYTLYALPAHEVEGVSEIAFMARTPCILPGIPFPPGCEDEDGGGGGDESSNKPNRPELKPAPEDVIPPVVDPDLDKAYGLSTIHAVEAWKIHQGSKKLIVANIDTGVDYNHPDLAFNMWRNPSPSDKNDVVGFDFVHNDGLPYDDNKHGTHTAGTIGAVGGNGAGISGVSPRVSIMALKFLSGEGSGSTSDAIRAIDYAIAHGAKILSNSWGGKGGDNKALRDAIERAREKDVLFVVAAGNDAEDNDGKDPQYPAAFDNENLISVAATDKNDKLASFSNYGKKTTHLEIGRAHV